MINQYSCHYNIILKNTDVLLKIQSTTCWAGLSSNYLYFASKDIKEEVKKELEKIKKEKNIITIYNNSDLNILKDIKYIKDRSIYIENFEKKETIEYLPLLIQYINKITNCEIVEKSGKKYIKYKLIEGYDNNLILLNFIRNLWNTPSIKYFTKKSEYANENYSIVFFNFLKDSKKEDALEALTEANKKACTKLEITNSPGHSNVHDYNLLKIKKTEDLFKYKGYMTIEFLTK